MRARASRPPPSCSLMEWTRRPITRPSFCAPAFPETDFGLPELARGGAGASRIGDARSRRRQRRGAGRDPSRRSGKNNRVSTRLPHQCWRSRLLRGKQRGTWRPGACHHRKPGALAETSPEPDDHGDRPRRRWRRSQSRAASVDPTSGGRSQSSDRGGNRCKPRRPEADRQR